MDSLPFFIIVAVLLFLVFPIGVIAALIAAYNRISQTEQDVSLLKDTVERLAQKLSHSTKASALGKSPVPQPVIPETPPELPKAASFPAPEPIIPAVPKPVIPEPVVLAPVLPKAVVAPVVTAPMVSEPIVQEVPVPVVPAVKQEPNLASSAPVEEKPLPQIQKIPEIPSASVYQEQTPAPVVTPPPVPTPESDFNLEQFLGAKLMAWVGGIILFLGVAFALKYSFENHLISDQLRMCIGAVMGIGLVIGGAWPKSKRYMVLSQTLCATGIVILYSVLFASRALYHLIPEGPTFVLMVIVTAAAFSIAVALNGQYVAILGLLGGFLTPVLLHTHQDHTLALFAYIFLLNTGLALVVLRKNWAHLQILATLGTIATEIAWSRQFYHQDKIWALFAILTVFQVGYTILFHKQHFKNKDVEWHFGALYLHGFSALVFFSVLLFISDPTLSLLPQILGFLLIAASLFYASWLRPTCQNAHALGGLLLSVTLGSYAIFYHPDKVWTVFGVLTILQTSYIYLHRRMENMEGETEWHLGSVCLQAGLSLIIYAALLIQLSPEANPLPHIIGMLLIGESLFYVVWRRPNCHPAHLLGGLFITAVLGSYVVLYHGTIIWTLLFIVTALQASYLYLLHRQSEKNEDAESHLLNVCIHGLAALLVYSALLLQCLYDAPLVPLIGMLLISASLFYAVWLQPKWYWVHSICGMIIFATLGMWIGCHDMTHMLKFVLAFDLIFAVLHCAGPAVLKQLRDAEISPAWTQIFPIIAMLLLFPAMDFSGSGSPLIWSAILGLDLIAMFLTLIMATFWGLAVLIVLTLFAVGSWMAHVDASIPPVQVTLMVGGFAAALFAGSIFVVSRYLRSLPEKDSSGELPLNIVQLPALSAALPYLLLIMMIGNLHMANPSQVFALSLLLSVMLVGTARWLKNDWLMWIALVGAAGTQYFWFTTIEPNGRVDLTFTNLALGWNVLFFAFFFALPFVFKKDVMDKSEPWIISCASGLIHFLLIYLNIRNYWHVNNYLGLVPAVFILPYLGALFYLIKSIPEEHPQRNTILALFGGTTLFFVTIIFPIQFDKEWLIIAWALEGLALIWLRTRIPHNGLWMVGTGLLTVAFVRLTLNPDLLTYHVRSGVPILNWYLYTYGLVIVPMFLSAYLLKKQNLGTAKDWDIPSLMTGAAAILLFILMNIEIADYFISPGATLTFEFYGNFARDMAYSICWAIYALGLLISGIYYRAKAARYASIALFAVTVAKVFFHDISELNALYRIGALMAVAVLLIVSSFLYQKFITPQLEEK